MFDKMHNFLLLLILMCSNIFQTFSYTGLRFQVFRSNGTDYSIEYLQDDDDLKYPRTQEDFQKIKKMWENYYACLEKKNNEESKPEIRRLVEGQFTEFVCDICPKPFQNYDEIEWKYKSIFSDANFFPLESLDLTPEMILTNEKHLKIYNIQEHFTGLYVCYHGRYPVSAYILEVTINDAIQEVNEHYSDDRSDLQISNLQTYRMWSEWTECSSCEIVGRRFKYGSCMVTIRKKTKNTSKSNQLKDSQTVRKLNHLKYRIAKTSAQNRNRRRPKRQVIQRLVSRAKEHLNHLLHSTKSKTSNTTMPNVTDFGVARRAISAFQTGIPCMSPILPKFVFESIDEDDKAVQAVAQFCLVPCQQIEIFTVLDNSGKVIETANNSAGVYSLHQKIPQLPPEIERRTVVAEFGKDIIIQCPGTTLKNIPVTWKINKQIIFPAVIGNESNGRFTIDPINRIHLKKLRLKDNHIYSCWQRDKLVGTVHLFVEKNFTIGLDHHVMLCLTVIMVGIFIFMGTKLCKRELEMNKK